MKNRVCLRVLKTAVPSYVLEQHDVRDRARHLFRDRKDIERLLPLFENAGIDRRHSCVPVEWYDKDHNWIDRTQLYVENAVALLEKAALAALDEAKLVKGDIDGVVVASTTGVVTPSLDALIVERLSLRRDVKRLPIFGLGCAGGVTGLARAAEMAAPGRNVLFLVVELCALTFRKNDLSKSNLVATALFGDGAAAAILSPEGDGARLGAAGEHTWPDSLDIMGWDIEEDGLKARFAQSIPSLVASDFRRILLEFLGRHDVRLADVDDFACHPGGAKVLDALEQSLGIEAGALADSRAVLKGYGNMSAATVFFVLERMKARLSSRRTLATALGPGFSASFLILDPC